MRPACLRIWGSLAQHASPAMPAWACYLKTVTQQNACLYAQHAKAQMRSSIQILPRCKLCNDVFMQFDGSPRASAMKE
eukprot:1158598-Pelagomonas_calceolata.AAC.1